MRSRPLGRPRTTAITAWACRRCGHLDLVAADPEVLFEHWTAEVVRGDVEEAVRRLKQEPGEGLWVGGVTLPLTLADLGLIDEYEFLVQPILAGHGPTLLAGLRKRIRLELVDRHEFRSGAVALRYRPTGVSA
jgi:dihydrofolate reductase